MSPETTVATQLAGKTFCMVNLGCKVNRVEADTIAVRLEQLGGTSARDDQAELVVVNTCTVTGEADRKARKAVRHALAVNPRATVVVTGCAAAVDPQTYRSLSERVEVVERTELFERIDAEIARRRDAVPQAQAGPVRFGPGFRTRVNIKVQDGCDRACTYCIVHVARGRARSAPFTEVLEEASRHIRRGAKELVLAGIDLGAYRDSGRGITELAEELLELCERHSPPGDAPARIRCSSLEPVSIDEKFVELMAASGGRLCRHLHLPLQSGSSKVLKEMARPYSGQWYGQLVGELYDRVPQISLTTDIICGFPGETEDDFEQTMRLARECRFSKIHVFSYSRRAGTPAARRTDQVSAEEKARRSARLRKLGDQMRRDDLRRRAGLREMALVEERCATTESYHETAVPQGAKTGDLVWVTL